MDRAELNRLLSELSYRRGGLRALLAYALPRYIPEIGAVVSYVTIRARHPIDDYIVLRAAG